MTYLTDSMLNAPASATFEGCIIPRTLARIVAIIFDIGMPDGVRYSYVS